MSGYSVRCADGVVRHDATFSSSIEAETFAKSGHRCTPRHTIEWTTRRGVQSRPVFRARCDGCSAQDCLGCDCGCHGLDV